MGIRVHNKFQKEIRVLDVFGIDRLDIELAHGSYESLDAIQDIFVDGETIETEFLSGVAILMDDFHLLHYC